MMPVVPQKSKQKSKVAPLKSKESSSKIDDGDDPDALENLPAADEDDPSALIGGIEADDFVSPMTIETYVEYRSKQLLRLCESDCPWLAKRLERLETLLLLIGATGTLLAALDQVRWVAITVAATTAFMNVIQHQMLPQRLSSTNSAVRELNNLKFLMDSLTFVMRRTQAMKTHCVCTVENAILETTTAWTGMTARPSVQVKESKKEK